MPKVFLKRMVNLTSAQAFAIAADVAAYKDFLPLVTRSTIRGEVKIQGIEKCFTADLLIAVDKLSLREGFTSHVTINSRKQTVIATSQDGPVKNLRAVWQIETIDESRCNVSIEIDYQFKSFLMQMAASSMMDYAIGKVMQAFEDRGRALYSPVGMRN